MTWGDVVRAEYRVLGPLEVLLDGTPVAVPAGRCHLLLATLLRPNQFVSVDELVERLWDGAPPNAGRAHKTLQMVVRWLRIALGEADCVQTRPGGYLAVVEPDQLDLLRFRALAGSGDFGAASALWCGPVLRNVMSDVLHREDVPRLTDERLAVLERRIDADLDRGPAGELVAELRSLVAEHPLREPFWCHLMLALYRSGQQAEALSAFQDIRTRLVDELGVDPGPALQELHQQILRAEVAPGKRPRVPRQLPQGVRNFVGREEELRYALGQLEAALAGARRAVEIGAELADRYLESLARANSSFYLSCLGRYQEALDETDRAVAVVTQLEPVAKAMVEFGDVGSEADVLELLGTALVGLNRREEAVAAWQRTVDIWRDLGDERAEPLAARPAELKA